MGRLGTAALTFLLQRELSVDARRKKSTSMHIDEFFQPPMAQTLEVDISASLQLTTTAKESENSKYAISFLRFLQRWSTDNR